jgi:hypothetical protein
MAGGTAFSLGRQIREKVWSAATAGDAGPGAVLTNVTRRDYFPSRLRVAARRAAVRVH